MNQSQMTSMGQQLPIMSQPQQVINNQNSQMMMKQLIDPSHMMMNQSQTEGMLNHRGRGGYRTWYSPQVDRLKFKSRNTKPSGFVSASSNPMGLQNHKNWKGKKGNNKRNKNNWKELPVMGGGSRISSGIGLGMGSGNVGGGGGYNPPTLKELQQQNGLKARRYFPKKKFSHGGKSAPFAPRNTTSFLIRAKKAGGIASLVSPCPVTPAVLPTPIFSPSREVLVDMAKEEWGVDGYGSMKGLIRLRSPGNEADAPEDEDDEESGSSESDVEEHLEVERRLDHDLSRFEMIYPDHGVADHSSHLLENRVDDQDTHIAQLEEENLILKERLFLMEREFNDLRMRLQYLERRNQGAHGFIEEVVENDSGNESESHGYDRPVEENNELMKENNENQYCEAMEDGNQEAEPVESNDIEKGSQALEEQTNVKVETKGSIASETKDEVLKGVGVADLHMEDEENRTVHLEAKEDNDGTVEEKGRTLNGVLAKPR